MTRIRPPALLSSKDECPRGGQIVWLPWPFSTTWQSQRLWKTRGRWKCLWIQNTIKVTQQLFPLLELSLHLPLLLVLFYFPQKTLAPSPFFIILSLCSPSLPTSCITSTIYEKHIFLKIKFWRHVNPEPNKKLNRWTIFTASFITVNFFLMSSLLVLSPPHSAPGTVCLTMKPGLQSGPTGLLLFLEIFCYILTRHPVPTPLVKY